MAQGISRGRDDHKHRPSHIGREHCGIGSRYLYCDGHHHCRQSREHLGSCDIEGDFGVEFWFVYATTTTTVHDAWFIDGPSATTTVAWFVDDSSADQHKYDGDPHLESRDQHQPGRL